MMPTDTFTPGAGDKPNQLRWFILYLRLALAFGYLSAVASRLRLWGAQSSGWRGFVEYTAQVNAFLPASLIPGLAVISTILESLIAVSLLLNVRIRWSAWASGMLTFLFALAMTISFGIKEVFDYSVWVVSASSLLLAGICGIPRKP